MLVTFGLPIFFPMPDIYADIPAFYSEILPPSATVGFIRMWPWIEQMLCMSQGGRGSNLSKVAINKMAERHGCGQGTTGQRKRLLIQRGHHNDDVGAR